MVREARTIELTVISATNLKNVNLIPIRGDKCYVVAYIYPSHKQITHTDTSGGANPTWNDSCLLTCYEGHVHPPPEDNPKLASSSSWTPSNHMINLEIFNHGSGPISGMLHPGDIFVGSVAVLLQDVSAATARAGALTAAFDVLGPGGKNHGKLNLSVRLGGKRPLGEYEELSTPEQVGAYSSYSQMGDPSQQPPMNYAAPPPAYDADQPPNSGAAYPGMGADSTYGAPPHHPETKVSSPSSQNSVADEDVATGYPAPGHAFDPLNHAGQIPAGQQQYGDGSNISQGAHTSGASTSGTDYVPLLPIHRMAYRMGEHRAQKARGGGGGGGRGGGGRGGRGLMIMGAGLIGGPGMMMPLMMMGRGRGGQNQTPGQGELHQQAMPSTYEELK